MRSQRNVERGHNRLIHCYDTHAATTAESRHINSHSAARAHKPNQRICVAFHSTRPNSGWSECQPTSLRTLRTTRYAETCSAIGQHTKDAHALALAALAAGR
jgi:hypothetical protein